MDKKRGWIIGACIGAAALILILTLIIIPRPLLGPRDNLIPGSGGTNIEIDPGDNDPTPLGGSGDLNGDGIVDILIDVKGNLDDLDSVTPLASNVDEKNTFQELQNEECTDPGDINGDCVITAVDIVLQMGLVEQTQGGNNNIGLNILYTFPPCNPNYPNIDPSVLENQPFLIGLDLDETLEELATANNCGINGFIITDSEKCDDGNFINGDGCSADFKPEVLSGNINDPLMCPINSQECINSDFNNDGLIDILDFYTVLSNWSCVGSGCKGDTDSDGDVDINDFLGVLSQWHTDPNVILVFDVNDLNFIRFNPANKYRLMCNIDLQNNDFDPIGNSTIPFTGDFFGNGYQITNLNIDVNNNDVGLFGEVLANSVISRLGVRNATVNGNSNVGILVGKLIGGEVRNSYVCGEVFGSDNVGGLVGTVDGGTIKGSMSLGHVNSSNGKAGGLAGRMVQDESFINVSFSRSSVVGSNKVGGLVGEVQDESRIAQTYSNGFIFGAISGGLIGSNSDASVSLSYWDVETSGQSISAGGEGRNTQQMTEVPRVDTYIGWRFVGQTNPTWDQEDEHYPWLAYLGRDQDPLS